MKLVHLSDLHLGKRVCEFSMLEQQKYILDRIIDIVSEEKPDAVLIAGDIYDKPVPPAEAVELFDDFLVKLAERGTEVFAISGNHDSPERIAFGSRLMAPAGVHLSPVYGGEVTPFELKDGFGSVFVYMLPFVKPANVRRFFPDEDTESYDSALRTAVKHMDIDTSKRNVIIAHQFVTGAERCESESISVGGLDDVGADIFEPFDYAALGHIHGAQHILSEKIRYCGTPLKYSFSEVNHKKSVTIAELKEKGSLELRTVPLVPLNDMREIKGSYMEVTNRSAYTDESRNDFLHVTLTDEQDIPEAMGRLRAVYPNIMKLDYDNLCTRSGGVMNDLSEEKLKSPEELFSGFYEQCNNSPMTAEQSEYVSELIKELFGDNGQ